MRAESVFRHDGDARGRASFRSRGLCDDQNGTTPPGGGWVPDGSQDLGLTLPCSPWRIAWSSMAGAGLESAHILIDRRLGPSVDEQRASLCARARASCQWRQLANYIGRLHPIVDGGHR